MSPRGGAIGHKNVLIVGAGVDREFGFRTLVEAGHTIGVVDDFSYVPTDMADWVYGFSSSTVGDVAQVVSQSGIDWDVVVCWGEYSLPHALRFAEALGIPGPKLNATAFRDKSEMRRRLSAAGLRHPQFFASTDGAEVQDWLASRSGDHVVKPLDYAGSSGVALVLEGEDPSAAIHNSIAKSPSGASIAEQRMIGPEYSVESVSRAGKHHTYAITQKFTSAPPYFVETGHLVPAALTPEVRESIEAEVHAALTKFEMVTGSSHAEVILTADGPTIVEIAGRLGGDLIPRLVWESLGVNLYDEELNAILGRAEISETSRDAVVSAVRFYEVEPGTRIVWPSTSSVQDTLLARTMRDSKHWYPHYVDAPVVDGAGRRLGYCLMVGNREEVEASFELATRLAPQKAVGGIS